MASLPPTSKGALEDALPGQAHRSGAHSAPQPPRSMGFGSALEPDRELGPESLPPARLGSFEAPPPTNPLGLTASSPVSKGPPTLPPDSSDPFQTLPTGAVQTLPPATLPPGSLPPGSLPPTASHGGPQTLPPGSAHTLPPPGSAPHGGAATLPPHQVAAFGLPVKPPTSGSFSSMPPRSHAGMGLGPLPTIASSAESADVVEQSLARSRSASGRSASPRREVSPVPQHQLQQSHSRASVSQASVRSGSQPDLSVRHLPGTGLDATPVSPASGRSELSSKQAGSAFVAPPFAPAPPMDEQAPAPSVPTFAPSVPTFAPTSLPPTSGASFAAHSGQPTAGAPFAPHSGAPFAPHSGFVSGGPNAGAPFAPHSGAPPPPDGGAPFGGHDRLNIFSSPSAGGKGSGSGMRSPRTAEWEHPDFSSGMAPGPGSDPSVDARGKQARINRPEQLIMVLGIVTLALALVLPVSGALVLLGDRHFRFWMGWGHPVMVLALSACTVLLLILTAGLLYRRASPTVLNEHTMIHVGSVFAALVGLAIVLESLPASRDMYITAGLLANGCSTAIPDSTVLQAHSKVLYNIRATPDCAEEESVEDCQGWAENRYTSYLRFLEEDLDCGPLCPEETLMPDNARPLSYQEAHARALKVREASRAEPPSSGPWRRGVITGEPETAPVEVAGWPKAAMLQGRESVWRIASPRSARWSYRGRHRRGKGASGKASLLVADPPDVESDYVVGDVVVLTMNATALENSYDHIDYVWRDLMHGMLGKEYRVLQVPQPGIVGLPSPDGSQKGVWYFPNRLVSRVGELIAHPLVTPEKLFSPGETRMSCYPLVSAHITSLAWSFTDPMFWQGVCMLLVSVLASTITFLTVCCCPGHAWKSMRP